MFFPWRKGLELNETVLSQSLSQKKSKNELKPFYTCDKVSSEPMSGDVLTNSPSKVEVFDMSDTWSRVELKT